VKNLQEFLARLDAQGIKRLSRIAASMPSASTSPSSSIPGAPTRVDEGLDKLQ
jgi:hypothetical protein